MQKKSSSQCNFQWQIQILRLTGQNTTLFLESKEDNENAVCCLCFISLVVGIVRAWPCWSTLDQLRHLNPCENWFWSRQGCDTEWTRVWRLLSVAAQNTMVWTTQSVEWSNVRLFSTAFTPGKRFELCEPPSSLSLWWTRSLPVGNHLLDYRDWKVHSQLVGATWHLPRRC